MKCFNHHDRDAFAVCKACGKALCLECAEEYKGEFICKGSPVCRQRADIDYGRYCGVNRYILFLCGLFLLAYILVKSFMCFILPCPFGLSFESVLIMIFAVILIVKSFKG